MRALLGLLLAAACFIMGAVVSQATIGSLIPVRQGPICGLMDLDTNNIVGTFPPRRDDKCYPVDWRLWHPL